jgi:penicillin amidase
MQASKRLLRAHWAAVTLPLVALCLAVAYIVWLAGHWLAGRLGPTAQLVVGVVLGLCALLLVVLAFIFRRLLLFFASFPFKLRASRPRSEGRATIEGLSEEVTVTFDQFGTPTVRATSRLDAARALGYVSARDRLFQMDTMRRAGAGRLSEVVGRGMLERDTEQRVIGLGRAAERILSRLPEDQRALLQAYSEGVNAYISQMKSSPFEFQLLNYKPETWAAGDCVLVLLQMFQNLCGEEEPKRRTLAVMERTLPAELTAFLTPDTDPYTSLLGWAGADEDGKRPLPRAELAALLGRRDAAPLTKKIVKTEWLTAGSNCWVLDKSKTAAGASILCNDMHTELGVPNLWYRARLCYDGSDLSGITLPGIPLVLAGSNTHVAWGLTNMLGACLDLVTLEIDPERPDHYMTPEGWRPFELLNEAIRLKRGDIINVEVRTTVWGPVLEKKLMGEPVALRWTALDPEAVDFGLMHMEKARTVEDALPVINRFGGPPLNVLVADEEGQIAYTLCGRLPVREGNGANGAAGGAGWAGYIHPDELPRVVGSAEGFLVNANNRSVGAGYPHVLGHGYVNSYRAYRIAERLREVSGVGEADMFALQFDTACHVYEFYRQLALGVLTDEVVAASHELSVVRREILAWDGRAELDSRGLAFLIYFRESLAQSVLTPILRSCAEADEQFVYAWPNLDTPLRRLLTERPPELLAGPEAHASWDSFLMENMQSGVASLREKLKVKSLENLNWGRFNKAEVFHPLTRGDRSPLGSILNMPADSLPGCNFSVCASEPSYGASVRMVVSPGREGDGVLHMPCGQSGHPLSESYDDQHPYWVGQAPLPFLPGTEGHTLTLTPRAAAGESNVAPSGDTGA